MEKNNQITLEEYTKEVEEQNKFLLNEMKKHNKNSQIYKLRYMQYQTNILNMGLNLKMGTAFIGQAI
jgi:hypothetical protein